MRRTLTIAVLLLVAPVLLVGGMILARVELDLTPYRQQIGRLVGQFTGAEVLVDGRLQLRLGSELRLRVSKLRVATDDAGTQRRLTIGELSTRFDATVLLGGPLRNLEMEIADAELELQSGGAPTANTDAWVEPVLQYIHRLLQLRLPDATAVRLTGGRIFQLDETKGTTWQLVLESADLKRPSLRSPLQLAANGEWNGLPLRVSVGIEPSTNGATNDQVTLRASVLGVEAEADGTLRQLDPAEEGLELSVRLSSKDLAPLRALFGDAIPAGLSARATMLVRASPQRLQFTDIAMKAGDARVAGDLSLTASHGRWQLQTALSADDLDLADWFATGPLGSDEQATLGMLERLAQLPVPLPLDLHGSLDFRNLRLPGGRVRDVKMKLEMDSNELTVDSKVSGHGAGDLHAQFSKGRRGDVFSYRMSVRDSTVMLENLVVDTGFAGRIQGELSLDMELLSLGDSADAIRSGLSGHIRAVMGEGHADVAALDNLVGGLTAAGGSIFSEAGQLSTVNCAATDIELHDGIAEVKLGLIDTSHSTTSVQGRVDLADGGLDLRVTPRKKALSLSVAPSLQIEGSIQEPGYRILKGSLFRSLGEFIANVAYPPTLLVGVFADAASTNPCVAMLSGKQGATEANTREP